MKARIETADLEHELGRARALIAAAGLPGLLARVDAGAFGTTPLNLETLDAVSRALATCLAAAKHPALGTLPPAVFGLLFAEEALDRLGALSSAPESLPPAGFAATQYGDLVRGTAQDALEAIVRDGVNFVRFYQSHADGSKRLARDSETLRCLRSYFSLLAQTARKLQEEPAGLELQTPRLTLVGLRAVPAAAEEPSDLLPVTFDDIVGNEDFAKAGRRLARDVAGFDLKAGKNPKRMRNQVLFVLGSPGCGKTVTAHAIGNYFLGLCDKAGLPGRMRVIRRTDWASSYQNQSANTLLEIFREEVFNAPGVCGVYWPDIDTAFAARSDGDIRQEERANLGAIFGILDGTIGPKNGRWFLVCDANTLRMDEATLSRLSQAPLKALGPVSPDSFVKLLRDVKLRGKEAWLPISPEEWLALGRRCVEEKLSGRSVDALAGRILTEMEDFEEPDEYFSLPFEEKQKLIDRLSRNIPAARVQDLITDHVRFERESQAKAEADRFLDRVKEIRFHLSAQAAAASLAREREKSGGS
ncbi:MAG: AAA family ATPase [Elusimicrobia bacterium]|nr:AAA family ATPase [Elusimicrobiota bacterium]